MTYICFILSGIEALAVESMRSMLDPEDTFDIFAMKYIKDLSARYADHFKCPVVFIMDDRRDMMRSGKYPIHWIVGYGSMQGIGEEIEPPNFRKYIGGIPNWCPLPSPINPN